MALQAVLWTSLFAVVFAQYPERVAPAPPRHRAAPIRQEEPEFRTAPQHRSPVFNPAAVHYVNIGAELQGDYKFGYDTGKGQDGQSFREETRLPDGSVKGAYGYVDASGKQRIVKYSAGKDGYKVENDAGSDSAPPARTQARQAPEQSYSPPQPVYRPPQQAYIPPQQSYVPPQETYAPQQESYDPVRQSYNPPQQSYSPPQQSYNPPEESYSPPQQSYRPPQQSYRPPQQSYSPPVRVDRPQQYRSRQAAPTRPQAEPSTYDYDDYDSSNELNEPRIRVPIDTTLFNYNIGINPSPS